MIYGLEKFHQYTFGRLVIVHSDHKPLEPIVKKSLFKVPKRLQRMLLRMQKYDVQLVHRKGTQMELADTLSRAYLQEEVTPFELGLESINMAQYLPISAAPLGDVRVHAKDDPDLQTLCKIIAVAWPSDKREVLRAAVHYFQFRDELSELDGIIFRGNQAAIPSTVRRDMLERIHSAHIEIDGCLRRAREFLYWPSMSSAVNDYIDINAASAVPLTASKPTKRCILIKGQVDRGRKLRKTSSTAMTSIILSQWIITLASGKLMHCQTLHRVMS